MRVNLLRAHGTRYCYDRGCRCSFCTANNRERKRIWRAENPAAVAEIKRRSDSHNRDHINAHKAQYRKDHPGQSAESHRKWQLDNPDKIAEYQRRTREKNRDVLRERVRARYWAKRDEILEYKRKHHQLHPEIDLERARSYRECHKAERAALQRLRKARKMSAPGVHTAADVTAQYERQHGKCYWCHKKVGDTYHVDHVVPLILGGSNGPENLVISCPSCNLSKCAKHPMDFAGVLC